MLLSALTVARRCGGVANRQPWRVLAAAAQAVQTGPVPTPEDRPPEELAEEDAERLRRAHHRLRKASQDLEAFTAPRRMRGRWEPAPVPAEAMDAARSELATSYQALWELYRELLGWEPPAR